MKRGLSTKVQRAQRRYGLNVVCAFTFRMVWKKNRDFSLSLLLTDCRCCGFQTFQTQQIPDFDWR